MTGEPSFALTTEVPASSDAFGGIVVPLDLTPLADRALATARVLAARAAVPIHLVTTVSPGLDDADDRAAIVSRALALHAPHVQVHVQHTDDVTVALAKAIDEVPHPALCVATHARTAVGGLLFGSTAEELLRARRVPSVLVGPEADPESVPRMLTVCVDPGGAPSELLHTAELWRDTMAGDLRVVEVVEPAPRKQDAPPELLAAARALHAPYRTLESHDPALALLELTAGHHTLLAVGSHLRHGLQRALLGSVAAELVRYSARPVIVVPGH